MRWVGADVALRLQAEVLQRLFTIFLLGTGLNLAWSTRPQREARDTSQI